MWYTLTEFTNNVCSVGAVISRVLQFPETLPGKRIATWEEKRNILDLKALHFYK